MTTDRFPHGIYRGQMTSTGPRLQTHDCATLEEAETRAQEVFGTSYEIIHTLDQGKTWTVVHTEGDVR